MKSKVVKWRKLDNSAKIFPIISNKRFSTVFRLSAILSEEIKPEILKQALQHTFNRFLSFKVKMRKGFFWYYLETNTKPPIVEKEQDYPCRYINQGKNNGYLLKVTYFEKKINIDIFHSLTDGNSAVRFFKELCYRYIELSHPKEFPISYRNKESGQIYNTEDSYKENYDKQKSKRSHSKKAYTLKGKELPLYAIGVIHGWIDLIKLKEICKKKQVSITQYLTAVLIQAIYKGNYQKSKKPLKICIPVNLKKYFHSDTITNFFSYISIETNQHLDITKFDCILDFVKQDFVKRLTKEEITKTMSSNVKLGNNLMIRLIPLFLKNVTVKMSYLEIRKYTTTTFSNIGRIAIMPEYKKYIKDFLFLIAPEPIEKIKCSACSYDDSLIFTFTSILKDTRIERAFFQHFKENGIDVKLESNGVCDAIP